MERGPTQAAWTSLDTLLTAGTLGSLSDGELLDHFRRESATAGQEAFRILVERHGPMVLGVCRSLVRDPHEAEDAFQATFLVLVRRADSIRRRETIAPWLYGVACRVARKARIRSARRRKREVPVDVDLTASQGHDVESSADDRSLQDEIRRLPASLRVPLILCCLEGQSYDQAARQLGMRESTVRGRLHRARKRLESRLKRRGVLAPLFAPGAETSRFGLASLAPPLIESTTQFAVRWSTLSGLLLGAAAGPESIVALAQGVVLAMLFQTIRVCALATFLTVGVIGTIVVAQQQNGAKKTNAEPSSATTQAQKATDATQPPSEAPRRIDPDRRTQQILEKLDETIEVNLPKVVALDQFLKAIKQATTGADFPGIPIYVDPLGLQEVNVSVNTEVHVWPNGPLGFVLRQTLHQVRLSYVVKDGFLMISSRAEVADHRLDAMDRKLDRLLKGLERLERSSTANTTEAPKP